VRRLLLALVTVIAGLLLIAAPRLMPSGPELPDLTWVATAHQHGPVGYRDPVGAISPDGRWLAYSEGRFLRVQAVAGGPVLEFPPGDSQIRRLAWDASGGFVLTDGGSSARRWARYGLAARTREALDGEPPWADAACVDASTGVRRIVIPCGGAVVGIEQPLEPYGPLAVSPDRTTIYFAAPDDSGTVDLWSVPARGGRARRLTSFAGDAYAPSVASDGTVLFKVQSYRTVVAQAPAGGGPTQALATFRSETPSWHPAGALLGLTYGSWRRVVDDARYPDIAQEAGVIAVGASGPASSVLQVVDDSPSEDQSLCWSPNGRWIAYHSHKDRSDDVWLRPADGTAPGRRISFLGRGAETGWPRWSPDGRWLLFTGADGGSGRSVIYLIGLDQESGEVTDPPARVAVGGFNGDVLHAEWAGHETLAAVGKEQPGEQVLFTVPRGGGDARIFHRFRTEHDNPGLAVSPDGRHVGFVAPASDGFFQIFRMPLPGPEGTAGPATAVQITRDPSHKTQPAWSPDGRRVAFTVWSYEAQFWTIRPGGER